MKNSTTVIVLLIVFAAVLGVGLVFYVVVLPMAIQASREAARREQTVNNLKQIGEALKAYHQRQSAQAADAAKVEFDTYSGYFVSNTFEPDATESFVVIMDQEQFDRVFGVAFVMGDKSHRLPKDAFKSLMVVAVIKRGEANWEFKVDGVSVKDGVIELKYTTTSIKSDTATLACPLIVSIPQGKYMAVQFVENGKAVKKIAVPVENPVTDSQKKKQDVSAESPRPLEFRTIALNGDKGGMLAVVNGEPRLVDSPSALTEWTLRETDKGWTIQSRVAKEAAELARYLSVDGDGKVMLVAEPGDGSYWKLAKKDDRLTSFDATLQTAAGKFKDWFLDFADQPEQLEKGRKAYQVKLSEKSGPRTVLHIFIDGP